jgi:membrane-bound inhibitor of C-type lysozyme
MASITEGVGGPVATPIRYLCADGSSATATYDNAVQPKVTIVAGSAMYHLNSVPSASGAKYSDGKVSWWTRGSEAYFELNGVSTICRR